MEHQIILKRKIIIEPEIVVELSGTPLECPWVASLRATGGGGRHHLGTSRLFEDELKNCEVSNARFYP